MNVIHVTFAAESALNLFRGARRGFAIIKCFRIHVVQAIAEVVELADTPS